jgi:hypothetical protein
MNDHLDPELDALLDAERPVIPPTAAALDRVWSRVERSAALDGANGGPSGAGRGGLASHVASVAGLAFVAGVTTGAGLYAALHREPPERVVYVERPAPAVPSPTEGTLPTATPHAVSDTVALAPASAASHASASHPVSGPSASSSLSAERAILDNARTALARGDSARAVALTDEHARQFGRPSLAEEREAIAVQALVIQGRYIDARARASRFRAAYPNSLFLPAVDSSVASIP